MAGDLEAVVLGNALSSRSRTQLMLWMEASLTGLDRLRANLPKGWRAVDKTGSNGEHTSNDIAVLWPMGTRPVVVAAYITQCPGPETKRIAILAEIGRLVASAVGDAL
jgi:beta-lactamase class A